MIMLFLYSEDYRNNFGIIIVCIFKMFSFFEQGCRQSEKIYLSTFHFNATPHTTHWKVLTADFLLVVLLFFTLQPKPCGILLSSIAPDSMKQWRVQAPMTKCSSGLLSQD